MSGVTDTAAGYGYGPKRVPTMSEGLVGVGQFDYDDIALRGAMAAPKGSKEPVKFRGCLQMSPAISTTPYDDSDLAFVRGLKEDGKLNPFNFQRHYTRYTGVWTFDLETLSKRPEAVYNALRAFGAGLKVGGGHTSNSSEFTPDVIVWRFHTAGGSGLFLSPHETRSWTPEKQVDLAPLYGVLDNLGIRGETQVGGQTEGATLTVAAALARIEQEVRDAFTA